MNEDWTGFVLISLLLLPVLILLLRVLYTQVQAHILEFFLTLVVSTLPMGVLLAMGKDVADDPRALLYLPIALTFGLFPMLLVFAGSMWGLSAAKRMREERTWHRLGLMLVGWTILPSFIGGLFLIRIVLDVSHPARLTALLLGTACLAVGAAPLVVAALVERRCRRPSQPTTFP